ncbi:MAG: hypothetical protein HUJ55_05315 [Ileibacterium sp.]|nr:hypothetical protein [Ileibacterium sp.]
MKKSSALIMSFVLMALLDSLLVSAFPPDFTYLRLSVIWHVCFIGMLIYLHDKPWVTRISCGALIGILLDFFFQGSFPFCFLVYPLFALLAGLPGPFMENNRIAFAVYMICCFLLDFVPYLVQLILGITTIPVWDWMYCMELLTTMTNAASVLFLMYMDAVMVRFFLIQRSRARKAERKKRMHRFHAEA